MRLGYWFREGLKIAAVLIVGSMVFALLMFLQTAGDELSDYVLMGALFLLVFGAFMGLALGSSIYLLHVPLAIGFGATRKETMIGVQCFRAVNMIPCIAISALLLWALNSGDSGIPLGVLLPVAVGLYLLYNGFGAVLGVVSLRVGRVVQTVLGLALVVVPLAAFACAAYQVGKAFGSMPALPWIVLAVGAAVYGLAMIPETRTLKKYTVKL